MQTLDSEHRLLNLSSQGRQGLLSAFSDTKELDICNKVAAGFLLHKDPLQSTPSLHGVVLVHLDVDSLIRCNGEHELTSCLVLLDVPSSLIWAC